MSIGELACSYAVMALHDDGVPVTAEKIASLVEAANLKVESYWFGLFAKLAEKRNIEDLIVSGGAGGGGVAVDAVPRKNQRKRVTMTWVSVCLIRSSFQCVMQYFAIFSYFFGLLPYYLLF
uniref:60S acidic ribosomal protein P1 n=1 Tax=Cannabis sativa TaxID=3483 RepID=A0A803NTQ5_CANSA